MSPDGIDHKADLPFYKEIFDRERTRRKDLDAAISQPITVCSVLIALLYFLYTKTNLSEHSYINYLLVLILGLAFIGFLSCLIFLARSYNNLFWGFQYKELPPTADIREYQKGIAAFNAARKPEERKSFEEYLLNNYVSCADNHIQFNDRRSHYLYQAKKSMIAALLIAILGIILFIIKTSIMSTDNNPQQPQPTAQVQSTPLPELPREPTNRIVKGNLSDDRARPDPTSITKKDR